MLKDSYLFDAGWLFFAAWGMVVAVVSMAAFGRDLLRWRSRLSPAQAAPAGEAARIPGNPSR